MILTRFRLTEDGQGFEIDKQWEAPKGAKVRHGDTVTFNQMLEILQRQNNER